MNASANPAFKAPRNQLLEFKPRKALFGFKIDEFLFEHIVPVADLIRFLQEASTSDKYTIEYGLPFKGRTVVFKLYTDDAVLADNIRKHFVG